MIKQQDKSLGEMLIAAGYITSEQLSEALLEQKQTGEPIGKILVRKGYTDEKHVLEMLKGMLVSVFEVNGEFFGAEVIFVKEIIKPKKITPLPNIPRHFMGIISLRDMVIPVISMNRMIFNKEDKETEDTRIVILESGSNTVGLIADRVLYVRNYSAKDFENMAKNNLNIDKKYVAGIIRDKDGLITLLKPEFLAGKQD